MTASNLPEPANNQAGAELAPRMRDLLDTLRGDPVAADSHTVEMTRLMREIEKGHRSDATPEERELAKSSNNAFWKSAMKRLKTPAENGFRRNQDVIDDPESLLADVYLKLAKLLTGKFRINDRGHFYRLAARNFRYVVGEAITRKRRRRNILGGNVASLDDTNLAEPPAADTGPSELAERFEIFQKYLGCDGKIDEGLLEIYDRHTLHGQSFRVIAEEMGIPRSTVSDRFHQANNQLQNLILGSGENDGALHS